MKQAQRKDFFWEIKKSLNRYLSILFIVALGVAFYAGIRSSEPDMQLSADAYFDQTRLMDIRVLGTLGLSEENVAAIEAIDGIAKCGGRLFHGFSVRGRRNCPFRKCIFPL